MNREFITKITSATRVLLMQSKTEEFAVKLDAVDEEKSRPRSFELYEEYSQRSINETIRTCRDSFENANADARKGLLEKAEKEVYAFRFWLEETKNVESDAAHYIAVSLKSLLMGLPMGVQFASLFDTVLKTQTANTQ
jgi:hypothetical protein